MMKNAREKGLLRAEELEALIQGEVADPFVWLGVHEVRSGADPAVAIRVLMPGAESVALLDGWGNGKIDVPMRDKRGFFELVTRGRQPLNPYRIRAAFPGGLESSFYDAYGFWPVLTEYDLYLFNEGRHHDIYRRLGAQVMEHQGVRGTLFAVWAPAAKRVGLVGDFNQWDGRRLRLRNRGSSGVWELFVPHVDSGALYKFEILTADNVLLLKSDPYGFRFEQRPKTASVVHDLGAFVWSDEVWMERRSRSQALSEPMAIYEMHAGSWRRREDEGGRWLTYRELADELIPYVKEMGFTHIEFLPLAEHPFDGSWGYQVTGYYGATSRFGSPEDLMFLVDACHRAEIGVLLDWVPAHFPKDPHALEFFDGSHLYEHADPRKGHHRDWDTLIFNYGRNEVRNFLVANALFWLDRFHFDGLRVDAVASMLYLDYSRSEGEWIPNRYGGRENLEAIDFLKEFNSLLYERFPGAITVAEESTAWPAVTRPVHLGGLGFLFKWNMGWMHDMLSFMQTDPVFRRYHMNNLTFALLYAFHENFMLPLSHDEVVHGKASLLEKMPGDDWQKFANLRLLFGYMYAEPGKKIIFMGGEFGQRKEWDHDRALQWELLQYAPHRGLQRFVRELNRLYLAEAALHQRDFDPGGFEWIDFKDADAAVVSFIRRALDPEEMLLFVFNFTPVPRSGYRIGAPKPGPHKILMDSDDLRFGGSGFVQGTEVLAASQPWHGQPYSLALTLPPLGMLVLKPPI
ncbi:1,4-alpha-glucan branching enzyme [uncultured Desulfatiglans sp.]|nr:1,4-alpha-glucan branching enzyme [uncultured Desulfatiglans sp.]